MALTAEVGLPTQVSITPGTGGFYSGCDKIIGEFVYIFMDDDEKWA